MTDLDTTTSGDKANVSPLTLDQPSTVPEVLSQLASIQTWEVTHAEGGENDGVACFNLLYHQITNRVLDRIKDGTFADANFLATLDVVFACRYLSALRADAADPNSAPKSWKVLFERRDDKEISPLQFAVAGVNAHVNFDLPCAVVATCERLGTEPGDGTQRDDYDKVNGIFAEEMESLRQHFESRFERFLDKHFLHRVENFLGDFSVEAARDVAWSKAEVLFSLRRHKEADDVFVEALDASTSLAGHLLLVHL